jgi:hypothetical protein
LSFCRSTGQEDWRAPELLGAVATAQWEDAERALIELLRRTVPNLLKLAAGDNVFKPRAGDYLAANSRRAAQAIRHGSQRARRVWELREAAGTESRSSNRVATPHRSTSCALRWPASMLKEAACR